MNHEKLLDVLEDMHYAALLPHAEFHIDATKEELSEALKQLRELVERDTPKKVINRRFTRGSEYGLCPICLCECENEEWNEHPHCRRCGQALDWRE